MHGFYVQDGDTFYIIPAGQIYEDPNMVYPALNCVITPSGLKEIASDYVDFLKEQQTAYEEWIKENPDEDPDLYAGGETYSPPALTENAAVVDVDGVKINNINNIKEYLSEIYANQASGESTASGTEITDTEPLSDDGAASCRSVLAWPVCVAAGATCLLLRKRKAETTDAETVGKSREL